MFVKRERETERDREGEGEGEGGRGRERNLFHHFFFHYCKKKGHLQFQSRPEFMGNIWLFQNRLSKTNQPNKQTNNPDPTLSDLALTRFSKTVHPNVHTKL
jgi:hypothetical protein